MLSWEEAQSFNRLAELYDRLGELTDDRVAAWLPSVLPVGVPAARGPDAPADSRATGKALDLGCGAGRHAVVLAEYFEHVDAVDLSGAMIRLARRKRARGNISYLESDLRDLDGQYAFVLSSATLHHVPDLPDALRQIRGLIAPGGRAALVDTVSARPANPRWWLYGGEIRKFLRNLVRRGPAEAWEIFRLSTGRWLDHRVSDRYLSREQFERVYAEAFPGATFTRVGSAHAMIWDHPQSR
ncbi:Methyltransferase type 11 [Kribbella flavida DSM 17836]|uniref:Methyltransferase type 11 n=1 Tax=Kribbella flavida (strain DSM 17836 / JCM 10339 / NBRC 14399) TaxID=479435 RepID=D2PY36_KRIFD|nr:class I SAM-dependent methyltransferase [Kribbella flavida]ADB33642.1 Methyltransferase type 11 [Kribbella flavida DSM 17836]